MTILRQRLTNRLSAASCVVVLASGNVTLGCAAHSETGSSSLSDARAAAAIRVNEGTALYFDVAPDDGAIVIDVLGQLWQLPSSGGRGTRTHGCRRRRC